MMLAFACELADECQKSRTRKGPYTTGMWRGKGFIAKRQEDCFRGTSPVGKLKALYTNEENREKENILLFQEKRD